MRYLLDMKPGMHVIDAAREALAQHEKDANCVGFVFNGLVVRLTVKDSPCSLTANYNRICEEILKTERVSR